MKVVAIFDNVLNEIWSIYSIENFMKEANRQYFEATNEDKDHFKDLESAIDWVIESENLDVSVEVYEVL